MLEILYRIPSKTRKPTECALGILKQKVCVLKHVLEMLHADNIVDVIASLVILHNIFIHEGWYKHGEYEEF